MPCELGGFPVWPVGTHYSPRMWVSDTVPSSSLGVILSLGLDVFCHICILIDTVTTTCRKLSVAPWGSLSVQPFALDSQLCLLSSGRTPSSASVPSSFSVAWILPQDCNWDNCRAHVILFPSSLWYQVSLFFVAGCLVSWNYCFMYFVQYFVQY